MIRVDNKPLLSSEYDILMELKRQLFERGIDRFNEIKLGANNIQFNCPNHSDGQEKKPSCGMLTTDKGTNKAGTVHCFTCGYTANIDEMISFCFGRVNDGGRFGRDWLINNFLTVSVENRKSLNLDFNRNPSKINYITDEELDQYRYYHDYMYKRGLTDELIELYDIGYDANFRLKLKNGKLGDKIPCITFPVRDMNGNTLFIARRSIKGKFFHYPEEVEKPVYGLYELRNHQNKNTLIVAESFLNAITVVKYGSPAVALMGTGTQSQYEVLRRSPYRKIIAGFDGDEAGKIATEKLKKALRGVKIVTALNIPKSKDLNDLTLDEYNNLEEYF